MELTLIEAGQLHSLRAQIDKYMEQALREKHTQDQYHERIVYILLLSEEAWKNSARVVVCAAVYAAQKWTQITQQIN
jgi:hypothetical protein